MASLNFDIEDIDIEDTQRLIPSESIRHAAHHARRKRKHRRPGDPEDVTEYVIVPHPEPMTCRRCLCWLLFYVIFFILLMGLILGMAGGVFKRL